jgi:hypothetical protein
MANSIVLKRSAVAAKVPTTAQIALGELAINTSDGRLFTKKNNGADSIVEFLSTDNAFKVNVAAATTANITLSGTQTIDGVAVVAGDRVLVKDQSTPANNGIYIVSAGAWTRSAGMDTALDAAGAMVVARAGTVNGGKTFDSDFKSTDTLGTTAMTWSRMLDTGSVGSTVQAWDADLDAIAALAGTSGFLKKTAANTWSLDTSTYLTSAVTSVTGTAPIVSSGGNTPAISISAATTVAAGSMSAADKTKLDGIAAGATANTGTVTGVTGTAPIVSSGGTAPAISISAATTVAAGSMSAADKTKLDGIATGATANTGTVTSVGGTGTVNGITLTGTVTAAGSITLGGTLSGVSLTTQVTGTLPIANGGTNSTATPTNGGVGYGTGTAHAYTAAGTAGQALVSAGGAAPAWATLALDNLPGAWVKKAVVAATTANVTVATAAPNTLDGVTLTLGDRILVKNQTAPAENGIYTVTTLGTGANGVWARAADADTAGEISGATVSIDRGTTQGGQIWTTYFKDTDTLGTTAMTWFRVMDTNQVVPVANGGTGAATPILAAQNLGTPFLFAKSFVAVTAAGGTTEQTLATVTIPAGAMGPNGALIIDSFWSHSNSVNSKTLSIRVGGVAGTAVAAMGAVSQASTLRRLYLMNANSASVQKVNMPAGRADGYGQATASSITSAVNTAVAWDLVFTGTKSTGSETLTLEGYIIYILYGA